MGGNDHHLVNLGLAYQSTDGKMYLANQIAINLGYLKVYTSGNLDFNNLEMLCDFVLCWNPHLKLNSSYLTKNFFQLKLTNNACEEQGVGLLPYLAEGLFKCVRRIDDTLIYNYEFNQRKGCKAIDMV